MAAQLGSWGSVMNGNEMNQIPTAQQWERINHLSVELPAPALLDIHNALPPSHPGRDVIVAHLKKVADRNAKAHWIRALVLDANGNLSFDSILYDRAVARGKQETYFESAKEVFDKLQFSLSQISAYQLCEQGAALALQDGVTRQTLASMPELSPGVVELRKQMIALQRLAKQMEAGLTDMLLLDGTASDKGANTTNAD